jgi:hypothetical protein
MQNPKTLVSFGFQQIKGNFRRGLDLLIEKIGSQIAIHTSVQNTLFVVGTAMIRVNHFECFCLQAFPSGNGFAHVL